jgi:hypothetical protein
MVLDGNDNGNDICNEHMKSEKKHRQKVRTKTDFVLPSLRRHGMALGSMNLTYEEANMN